MTRKHTNAAPGGTAPDHRGHDTTTGRHNPISANDAELLALEILVGEQVAGAPFNAPAVATLVDTIGSGDSHAILDRALDIASHRPGCITGTECYACGVQRRQAVGS